MRHIRNPKMEPGEIRIDLKSRDDIPALLLGLEHLYADEEIRTRLFAFLEEQKVFSIFETHTRWISKGKAGTPVELGVPVCVLEVI